jgi:serine/threonine-protein kinase
VELGVKTCPSCALANANDAGFCIRCGFSLANVTADDPAPVPVPVRPGYLAPGALIDGKYRIERVLGEGGMGVVYLAHDVHTEMSVVVKAIRSEFAHNPEFRARTLAEGRALARIDHPNVVRLNAVVVEPTTLYLVMQFIDGEPLDALIERHVAAHTPVPIALAVSIFRMILRGVGAAHAEGLIHRDLKPANILVRKKDGVAKVTDFGIAKGEEDAKAGRGVTKGIIGSVAYMAPEQVRGRRDLDKRVDIYALGILFFELLIGRTPFDAPSDFEVMRMHAEAPMPSMVSVRPDVPAELDDVVRRACAKERDHRFANTDEFLAALDAPPKARTQPLTTVAAPSTVAGTGTLAGDHAAPTARPAGTELGFFQPPAPAGRGATDEGSALPNAPAPVREGRRSLPLLFLGITGAVSVAGAGVYWFAASDEGGASSATSATVLRPTAPSSSTGAAPSNQASAPAAGPNATSTATTPANASTPPASPTGATAGPSSAPSGANSAALAALAGPWRSTSNRDYLAVLTNDGTLEFRIQQPAQHPRQGYESGDVRFELKPTATGVAFAVEDHIRPTPPAGSEYDPRSRDSCIGTWTNVKGRPLKATVDARGTLVVELVQIRTGADKFKVEAHRVVACSDLAAAPAEIIESRLARVR